MSHQKFRWFGRLSASLLAGTLATTAAEARAEQFVLFDVTFSFTKQQADTSTPSKSHYYVRSAMLNQMRPANWVSPVDYRNGTVHIRTEVLEKPEGGAVNTWTLCYIPNKGIGAGYGCTGTGNFKEKGVYDKDESMTSWWQNTAIDWTQGIRQMDLVFKDGSGGSGFAHLRPDPEKYFPTKLRITMIQVSAGSKYDPSLVPNLAPSDGGAPAPATDAGASDARGTGGATGTGTGGSSGGGGGDGAGGTSPTTPTGSGGTPASSAGGTTGTPNATGGGSGAGTGGTSGSGSGGSTGRPSTSSPAGGGVSGGCSLATTNGQSATGLGLGLLGLLFAIAGRRRR